MEMLLLIEINLKIEAKMKSKILYIKDQRLNISYTQFIVTGFMKKSEIELSYIDNLDSYELIIIDLLQTDAIGLELIKEYCRFNKGPIMVLTINTGESDSFLDLIKLPVKQFLFKNEVSGSQILNSILWTIEKYKEEQKLQELVLVDEMTSVYNRRGFNEMSVRQLKMANRLGKEVSLFFIDLNYLKQINDNFGHIEGDNAIKAIAEALKATFRENDLVARLGGDEFVVMAIGDFTTGQTLLSIISRLQKKLSEINEQRAYPYEVSVSVGFSKVLPDNENLAFMVENLLLEADEYLYKSKKNKDNTESYVSLFKTLEPSESAA